MGSIQDCVIRRPTKGSAYQSEVQSSTQVTRRGQSITAIHNRRQNVDGQYCEST